MNRIYLIACFVLMGAGSTSAATIGEAGSTGFDNVRGVSRLDEESDCRERCQRSYQRCLETSTDDRGCRSDYNCCSVNCNPQGAGVPCSVSPRGASGTDQGQ